MNIALHDFEEDQKTLQDYLAILKRRWLHILIPALIIFMLAALVAVMLPATYRSTATVLIEEQEIPRDLVRSTITSFAAQQVQVINRRIMTVENVTQIADKHGLYKMEDGGRLPSTELVKLFSKQMQMDLVSADVIDPRSGRPTEATIAFTLAFENANPSVAQKVTNDLVTFYLNENLRTRAVKAQNTADFLKTEADSLNAELMRIEEDLAAFKERNEGSLPELYQYNLSLVDRSERELSDITLRIKELERRKIELAASRAQLNPTVPEVLETGEVLLKEEGRLKVLQTQYRARAAIYKDNHPDLIRLKREIQAAEADLALSQAADIKDAPAPDNPAYILLDTQLSATESDLRSLASKQKQLREKIRSVEVLIMRAPQVEKEYQGLLREYNGIKIKYQEIQAKLREAGLAETLEQERKGERFTLVEPPSLPLKPVRPNRPAIVLLGFILAGAVGLGVGLLFEALDSGIKGERALAKVLGEPVMAVVPYLENADDGRRRTQRIIAILTGLALLVAGGLIAVHLLVKPLDVLWFVLLQRFGLM